MNKAIDSTCVMDAQLEEELPFSPISPNRFPISKYLPMVSSEFGDLTVGAGYLTGVIRIETQEPQEFCYDISAMKELLDKFSYFPTSYNHVLVTGALGYCIKMFGRMLVSPALDFNAQFVETVRNFVSDVESLYLQYGIEDSGAFALLDLQMLEDRFDLIQKKSEGLGFLPSIDNLKPADI